MIAISVSHQVPMNKENNYKIIQWNCNGLATHLDEINIMINRFDCLALCIQETRFRQNSETNLKNFTCYYKNNYTGTIAHGGVCIYLNNMFKGEIVNINSQLQVIAVKIKFPMQFIICSIYISGSETFSENNLANILSQFDCPFLLLGDFNAHNSIWGSTKTDSRGKMLERALDTNELNLLNNINHPTHFSLAYRTFSNIDLSIVSPTIQHYFEWSVSDDLCNSDHYPILISLLGHNINIEQRPQWNIKKANWDKFQCVFNRPRHDFRTINEEENFITDTILSSACTAIPISKSSRCKRKVPWWNQNIKMLIEMRRESLKEFKNNPNTENFVLFLKTRSKVRKEIRNSKKASWHEFCETINLRTPTQLVYRKIKSLNGTSNSHRIPCLINGNQTVTDVKDITNCLAENFSINSSSENYSNKFRYFAASTNFPPNLVDNNELYNIDFTIHELNAALSQCKGSSPGPDNIRYEMITHLDVNAKNYLLGFYNNIWKNKVLPDNWRKALVIPILKPGKDSSNKNNYRPISLTNCLCKVLERMVNKRLVWFLEENNVLDINQSGFRRNRGTIDNLATLHTDIMEAFSKRRDLIAVFFDIRKAYDCVWRPLIFKKLNSIGMSGNIVAFISNFLSNRNFCCMNGNTLSDTFPIENGVPQGSVMSVTLFLLAIDEILTNVTTGVKAMLYADDLVIYASGKKISAILKKL